MLGLGEEQPGVLPEFSLYGLYLTFGPNRELQPSTSFTFL